MTLIVGIDPSTVELLAGILRRLTEAQSPRIILSLNIDEHLPEWVTHVMFLLRGYKIHSQGPVRDVAAALSSTYSEVRSTKGKLSTEAAHFMDDASKLFSKVDSGIRWGREDLQEYYKAWCQKRLLSPQARSSDGLPPIDSNPFKPGDLIVEMDGVRVAYGERSVLGDWKQIVDGDEKEGFWWKIRRGERWGVFGPNGVSINVASLAGDVKQYL
jgi:hypothetical protein